MDEDGFQRVQPQLKFVIPEKRQRSFVRSRTNEATKDDSRDAHQNGVRRPTSNSARTVHFDEVNANGSAGVDDDDESILNGGSAVDETQFSSAIFHNVKHQLEHTLSDPLRRRALGSVRLATGRIRRATGSIRRAQLSDLSNKLRLSKLFVTNVDSPSIDAVADDASSSDLSDDPEFKELEERSVIVEKYEKGKEQEVEDWENPDLDLYKVTDRYGFMHRDIAELSAQEVAEKKRIAKELSREQKWLRMVSQLQVDEISDKFKKRVWKGIPEKLRSLIWTRLLEVHRYQNERRGNVYKELLMRARLISKDIKQIDLDINRTYRDHLAFRQRYDVKQRSLFNVLAAYAMYNTEVGYCQGMSQIAALFLMYMDEEEAFWCLHSLLVDKRHSMHGFFSPGFPKLVRFQNHYEKVLQKYLPRLKKHLDKSDIPPIYLTKWWFGCFLDRIPFPLALRVWDVFLLEGDAILIAMSYNIMKMHQKVIKKFSMENFMEYIQSGIAKDFGYSDEETISSLKECVKRLHADRMLLPAPPMPNDPPELPRKPFGPVLSRSMIDIRMDIAEIQSRCSRANSVAGKSPAMTRRRHVLPSPAHNASSIAIVSVLQPNADTHHEHKQSNFSLSSSSTAQETKSDAKIAKKSSKVSTTESSSLANNLPDKIAKPKTPTDAGQLKLMMDRKPLSSKPDSNHKIGERSHPKVIETSRPKVSVHSSDEGPSNTLKMIESQNVVLRGPAGMANSRAPEEPPVDYDEPSEPSKNRKLPITPWIEYQKQKTTLSKQPQHHARDDTRFYTNDADAMRHRGSFYDNVFPTSSNNGERTPIAERNESLYYQPVVTVSRGTISNESIRRNQGQTGAKNMDNFARTKNPTKDDAQVMQLPNNVTYVRIGESRTSDESQLHFRSISTPTQSTNYGPSGMYANHVFPDGRTTKAHLYESNVAVRHRFDTHFPKDPIQANRMIPERGTCSVERYQPRQRRPVMQRSHFEPSDRARDRQQQQHQKPQPHGKNWFV